MTILDDQGVLENRTGGDKVAAITPIGRSSRGIGANDIHKTNAPYLRLEAC
jgi:hypothetical protein